MTEQYTDQLEIENAAYKEMVAELRSTIQRLEFGQSVDWDRIDKLEKQLKAYENAVKHMRSTIMKCYSTERQLEERIRTLEFELRTERRASAGLAADLKRVKISAGEPL